MTDLRAEYRLAVENLQLVRARELAFAIDGERGVRSFDILQGVAVRDALEAGEYRVAADIALAMGDVWLAMGRAWRSNRTTSRKAI